MLNFLPRKYLPLLFFLVALLCFPFFLTTALRVKALSFFSPFLGNEEAHQSLDHKIASENALLKNEVKQLRAVLLQTKKSIAELTYLEEDPKLSLEEQRKLLCRIVNALPARVFYRDPHTWGSSFWVSLGSEHLSEDSRRLLAKGSPVVLGRALVGVIDYVGAKQSRVRLITDSGVKPSVRVHRLGDDSLVSIDEIERVTTLIDDAQLRDKVKKSLSIKSGELQLLAKGFLEGSSSPIWRSKASLLKGIGFNYDHEDLWGPARDLHSGEIFEQKGSTPAVSLLKNGDLLMTTGMDGIFPEGLEVARVKEVLPLSKGAVAYELLAEPIVKNLDSIQTVFILPPYTYQTEDGPL
jgi:rod shape-determining protein MreC